MSIRGKLLDFKRRLSDRKMYSIVIVVIAAVAIFGIYQQKKASDLRQQLDNQYNRAFFDMVGYVNNVESILVKSLITSTPKSTGKMLQEAWRQANLAQTNLGQLPVAQHTLANTSKFLTQIGDLAYSLNNQNMGGKSINEKQYNIIKNLYGYSVKLGNSLNKLQNQLTTGRLKWGELADKGTPLFAKASKELTDKEFENIEKTFQSYPSLIYDGPFSDHLSNQKIYGLNGKNYTKEEAGKAAIAFFNKKSVKKISYTGSEDKGNIAVYGFTVTLDTSGKDDYANVSVTRKGGQILWFLNNRNVASEKIKVEKAKQIASNFLKSKGYNNMVDTYYLKNDNTAVINFAYKQNGIVIYPDLIKVKVALDNGEITGFEAKGYLSSHRVRSIRASGITMKQAREKLNKRLNIISSGMAIIPTDYKTELLTYEFKGRLDNRDFLVYINAVTGEEENILVIVDTPNGILTM